MKQRFTLVSFLLFTSIWGFSQPTIDGNINDAAYTSTFSATYSGDGFGSGNNLSQLKYHSDGTNIYIGISCDLESNNNVILFFNFSGYGGRGVGNTVAGSSFSGVGVFNTTGGDLDGAKMDMDIDYALAFNEGGGSTNLFMDAGRFISGGNGYDNTGFIGQTTDQSGTATSLNPNGITDGTGSMSLAYNNGGSGSGNGIEFSIPISCFAGVTSSQTVQLFAVISNNNGFLSDECIPGNPTGGNLGSDRDLTAIAGQDFFTSAQALPAELAELEISLDSRDLINLNWTTLSETQNDHFLIEKSTNGHDFETIGRVAGAGTTFERQEYHFMDTKPAQGTNYYRLKQVDFDGRFEYSEVVSIRFGTEQEILIFPNPVQEQLNIQLESALTSDVTVNIYGVDGGLVKTSEFQANEQQLSLPVNELNAGIYFIEIMDVNARILFKNKFLK